MRPTSGSLEPILSQVEVGLGLPVPEQGSSRLEYPTCMEVSTGLPFSVNAGATETVTSVKVKFYMLFGV